jgi:hypothetical protein
MLRNANAMHHAREVASEARQVKAWNTLVGLMVILLDTGVCFMDLYAMARLFRVFSDGTSPRRVIFDVGEDHANNYRRLLDQLGFERISEGKQVDDQCLRVNTFNSLVQAFGVLPPPLDDEKEEKTEGTVVHVAPAEQYGLLLQSLLLRERPDTRDRYRKLYSALMSEEPALLLALAKCPAFSLRPDSCRKQPSCQWLSPNETCAAKDEIYDRLVTTQDLRFR